MADQADALPGRNDHVERRIKRRRVAAIAEGHPAEAYLARVDADRLGVRMVGDAERLRLEQHQLLHLVDRALEMVGMLADVAQIAVQHQIGGEHVDDVAGARLARGPQP